MCSMKAPKPYKKFNITAAAALTAMMLTACGNNGNPSVLDIRNEIITEQEAERYLQQVSEQNQRQVLDTTRSAGEQFSDTANDVRDRAADTAYDIADRAGQGAEDLMDKASDTAGAVYDEAGQAAGAVVEKAGDTAVDTVVDTKDTLGGLLDGIGQEWDNLKNELLTPTGFSENNGTSKETYSDSNPNGAQDTGTITAGRGYTGTSTDTKKAAETSTPPFYSDNIPAYAGNSYVTVNGNVPFYDSSYLTTTDYESYSGYDSLGRCGTAIMCTSRAMMPQADRESIGMFKPSGWKQKKYDILKTEDNPAGYLMNRCHLLMRAVGGDDRSENLITGTRQFNLAMLVHEDMVLNYIARSGNHVIYRVTPVYTGDNLVADGVLMEAQSVEDNGLRFCVFTYNVADGIGIDYRTGESWLA